SRSFALAANAAPVSADRGGAGGGAPSRAASGVASIPSAGFVSSAMARPPGPSIQLADGTPRVSQAVDGCSLGSRGPSINVLLVSAFSLEVGDEGDRLVGRPRALRGNQIDQSALHVLAHTYCAADIDLRA